MKGIVRLGIKAAVYILILLPIMGTVLGVIFGWGTAANVFSVLLSIAVVVYLEYSGTSNKVLDKVFGFFSSKDGNPVRNIAESLSEGTIKKVETTINCTGCGSQVTLINGHGKCEACDNAY